MPCLDTDLNVTYFLKDRLKAQVNEILYKQTSFNTELEEILDSYLVVRPQFVHLPASVPINSAKC